MNSVVHIPTAAQLLDTWEEYLDQPALRQSLALLRLTCDTGETGEDPAELGVGAADRRLLDLREALFGTRFEAVCACPCCGERIELAFDSADVRAPGFGRMCGTEGAVEADGFRVHYRLPTLRDLAGAAAAQDAAEAQQRLVAACVVQAESPLGPTPARDLPESVVLALGVAIEQADPQACTRLDLHCPACGHNWTSVLDVGAFLWGELQTWAQRLLGEIHALATAYGWSESEVLALSPRRRRHYLDRIAG